MHYGRLPFASAMKSMSLGAVDVRIALRAGTLFVVLLLSVMLAVKWALIVPIFQNPDEPIHADYAFALMDARRIVPVAPDPNLRFVDPLTQYLSNSVNSGSIAFHPGDIVEPGYGTRAMYRAIDAHAPVAAERRYRARPEPSHLRYPVLYYGLIAVVGGSTRALTHSVVAAFFAMRLFGVALLSITLASGFVLLRLSGFGWVRATAVTAIVGLLPEQSFLSASIQPDNLAETSVTVTLLFAVLFRRKPNPRWFVLTAFSFGILYMTKLQYFVAVALPVGLLFLSVGLRGRTSVGKISLAAIVLFLPTAGWYAFKAWMSRAATIAVVDPFSAPTAQAEWAAAAHDGLIAFVMHGTNETLRAWRSFYFDGQAARSFWGTFGWMDTPLSFGNAALTSLVEMTIRYTTIVVMVAVLLSVGVQLFRLVLRAKSDALGRAFAIFVRDPLIFAVVIFNAIMLALWLRWGDFGFQGRYWLPLAFPIWSVVFAYGPRFLRAPRLAARVSGVAMAALLVLVAAETCFALPTVVQRFYLARHVAVPYRHYLLSRVPLDHNLEIVSLESCVLRANALVRCPSGTLHIGGWAIPGGPIGGILLTLDGNRSEVGQVEDRVEVAAMKKVDPRVGFEVRKVLTSGRHRIALSFISADDVTEFTAPERYDVIVTDQP